MLIFVKIKIMNTFFQIIFVFILSQILFNNIIDCVEDNVDDVSSDDFWSWMFGEVENNKYFKQILLFQNTIWSSNLRDNKPEEWIKEEMGHHYGFQLPPDQQILVGEEIDFHIFK